MLFSSDAAAAAGYAAPQLTMKTTSSPSSSTAASSAAAPSNRTTKPKDAKEVMTSSTMFSQSKSRPLSRPPISAPLMCSGALKVIDVEEEVKKMKKEDKGESRNLKKKRMRYGFSPFDAEQRATVDRLMNFKSRSISPSSSSLSSSSEDEDVDVSKKARLEMAIPMADRLRLRLIALRASTQRPPPPPTAPSLPMAPPLLKRRYDESMKEVTELNEKEEDRKRSDADATLAADVQEKKERKRASRSLWRQQQAIRRKGLQVLED